MFSITPVLSIGSGKRTAWAPSWNVFPSMVPVANPKNTRGVRSRFVATVSCFLTSLLSSKSVTVSCVFGTAPLSPVIPRPARWRWALGSCQVLESWTPECRAPVGIAVGPVLAGRFQSLFSAVPFDLEEK